MGRPHYSQSCIQYHRNNNLYGKRSNFQEENQHGCQEPAHYVGSTTLLLWTVGWTKQAHILHLIQTTTLMLEDAAHMGFLLHHSGVNLPFGYLKSQLNTTECKIHGY